MFKMNHELRLLSMMLLIQILSVTFSGMYGFYEFLEYRKIKMISTLQEKQKHLFENTGVTKTSIPCIIQGWIKTKMIFKSDLYDLMYNTARQ